MRRGAITVAAVLFVAGCPGDPYGYPTSIIAPEVVGQVEAAEPDPADDSAWLVTVNGTAVRVDVADDRRLQGTGVGDLLFFGAQPERWFLGAPLGEDGCYEIVADKGYDEPDAVILVFADWPGVGLRLPKAPGFEEDNRITDDPAGRPQYAGSGGELFCADERGQLTGLWPP